MKVTGSTAALAPVTDLHPQAAPLSPTDEDWAARVAAVAYRFGVTPRGARGMMAGFPSECQAAVMAELAAIAGAA
jgi:hypothetical protein